MSTHDRQETAKLYTFPTKLRPPPGMHEGAGRSAPDQRPLPFAGVQCGSGWYHEAAVQEELGRTRKP